MIMEVNGIENGCTDPQPQAPDTAQLVVMCYDAAIKDLCEAKQLHGNGHMDANYEKIRHAQDLITELLVGLDYERGGEIAQNLSKLYNFMLRQMIGITNSPDTTPYDQLIVILENLKGAWEQVRSQAH